MLRRLSPDSQLSAIYGSEIAKVRRTCKAQTIWMALVITQSDQWSACTILSQKKIITNMATRTNNWIPFGIIRMSSRYKKHMMLKKVPCLLPKSG